MCDNRGVPSDGVGTPRITVIPTTNTLSVTVRIDAPGIAGVMDGGATEMYLFLSRLGAPIENMEHLEEKRRQTLEAWGLS